MEATSLKPAPGVQLSPAPWQSTDEGTAFAADLSVVCVLGHPEGAFGERDVVNGALILAAPKLLEALQKLCARTLKYVSRPDGAVDPAMECDVEMAELANAGLAAIAEARGELV